MLAPASTVAVVHVSLLMLLLCYDIDGSGSTGSRLVNCSLQGYDLRVLLIRKRCERFSGDPCMHHDVTGSVVQV